MFLKSFCKSHVPHKSVNLSSTFTHIKIKNLCGNCLWPNEFENTSCVVIFSVVQWALVLGVVSGSGFRFRGLAFVVWRLAFGAWGVGLRVERFGESGSGSGFRR